MLNSPQYCTHSTPLLYSPFATGTCTVLPKATYKTCNNRISLRSKCIRQSTYAGLIQQARARKSPTTVKAVVTVKPAVGERFAHLGVDRVLDNIRDLFGKSLLLELVDSEHDPNRKREKVQAYARREGLHGDEMKYEATFLIPSGFGEIGGVLVENEHHKEMYLNDIILTTGDATTSLNIDCRSWLHSKFDNHEKRIFFTTKSYLPSATPKGLIELRKKELETIRGNGKGERKYFERIYDYDTYNDLGDPKNARPELGGSKDLPYPRRCRTGREKTDDGTEKRSNPIYIPRDESFSEAKLATFTAKTLKSVLHALVPSIETAIVDRKLGFDSFKQIDMLYNEGVTLPKLDGTSVFKTIVPRFIKTLERADDVLLFEIPAMLEKDKFSWLNDEEFSRQTLAGLNPISIQLVTEFPIVSKLDPEIYGDPESLITADVIYREIRGIMTVQQALEQKKLFMLDYHDLLLPFVHKVREQEDTTLYGSRTLFFLTPANTLRPIAIELTRPKSPTKPQWKQIFTHTWDATGAWLWKLAKVHVKAHDSGYHELVSHWLRTHCCSEPYVIAMNRQLSVMHPVYRLMHPHFRYNMQINALAREYLINANGVIETSFAPGKYSLELSSVAYREQWRFDMEALPADLIRRGLAVEDPTAEHGLKLTIEDYPYANDGLLIWSSIKEWVTDYINHYYPTPKHVQEDYELQNWWTEVRTKGHEDKKDEPWWPVLNTQDDLIHVITTIIWVTSGHHAAVNFGQYHYAGYFPNRPTTARVNIPTEDEHCEQFKQFWDKPEPTLLQCYPSQFQATVVMAILDLLSSHSPDEEYLGDKPEPAWAKDLEIYAAFERFNGRMKEIERIIDARNNNPQLKNRCGAGIVPYELLKPFSEPGVTGKGIPNSISI